MKKEDYSLEFCRAFGHNRRTLRAFSALIKRTGDKVREAKRVLKK